MSTQAGKDTIYIDVDDEITGIIDKVRGSEHRIVALVLPKRATVLQSVVNMKLLKRTADSANKHLVLITSEHTLMPLAGAVGLYVAKTLQSKPEIPVVPGSNHELDDAEEAVDMNDTANDTLLDKSRPIGEYAASTAASAGATGALAAAAEDEEPIEIDNADMSAMPATAKKQPKAKKDKKLKIPDFNKFRLWLALGAVGIVVIIFVAYLMLAVMPRASIVIKTDSSAIQTNQDVILSSSIRAVDPASNSVPAISVQTQKTQTQQVPSTGQQNNGQKATGTVTLIAQECNLINNPADVPAGTALAVSSNGASLTFITQEDTSFSSNGNVKNHCITYSANGPTTVTAQSAGAGYNVSGASFTVAGRSDVSGSGTTTGGTDNIIKVVVQADIDGAKQKLTAQDTTAIKSQLDQQLQSEGLMAIDATLSTGTPDVSTSANVGDQADTVTVTEKITYSMFGTKQSDLKTLIAAAVDKQIDPSKQNILDYGVASASFQLKNQDATSATVGMSDTAIAGSDLNLSQLKQQVAGKKTGDAKSIIGNYPGVTNVTVNYSPFWVSSIPGKTSKITITVEKPAVKHAQ
jgi:hypothetical protein